MRVRDMLTKKKFENWLKKNRNSIVCPMEYKWNRGSQCPLATYLKSGSQDISKVGVNPFYLWYTRLERKYRSPVPAWATVFMGDFDAHMEATKKLTADGSFALKILKEQS